MPTETVPPLVVWDWLVILSFFVVTLGVGLFFARKGGKSIADYFVAGRNMTWWVAGTSLVATSFAADTPLVIAGWMRTVGLERNWFWWGTMMGMMLCTFFYARLWSRSGVLTDIEINTMRYGGTAAIGLRLFHASYRSIIANTMVMAWVTKAMAKILDVTLDIPTIVFIKGQWVPDFVAKGIDVSTVVEAANQSWVIPSQVTAVVLCFVVAVLYTVASGLYGVMAADFFQFIFAMFGSIMLMVVVFIQAGGASQMRDKSIEYVSQGWVHNAVIQDRQAVDREAFLTALEESSADTDSQSTAADEARHQAEEVFNQLVATGLILHEDIEHDRYIWSADGLSEDGVTERLEELDMDVDVVVDQWKEAYTIGRGALSDSQSVELMLKNRILIEDQAETEDKGLDAETQEYYRLPDLSLSELELAARLDAAGVENKAEILAAWRKDKVVSAGKITRFLPPFDLQGGGLMAVWALVVFLGLQWWAGGQGDGFLVQRLMSCKNEKHAMGAMLWFNVANFALRPWPWIVVGVGSLFLIPDVTAYGHHYNAEDAYAIMLMKFLPVGLKGMMVAALMAAYMSTISTHVNFGASYLMNDVYMAYIRPNRGEHEYVIVSKVLSLALALLAIVSTFYVDTIGGLWLTFFELMSGAGFVVLLRWYWWRISAWSEIAAMFSSLLLYSLMNYTEVFHGAFDAMGLPQYWLDEYAVRFTLNLVLSTCLWLLVTFLTPPENEELLIRFYNKVRPAGLWNQIAVKAGNLDHLTVGWKEWGCWALGVTGLFAMIFALGKACFGLYWQSLVYAAYAAVAAFALFELLGHIDWSTVHQNEDPQT